MYRRSLVRCAFAPPMRCTSARGSLLYNIRRGFTDEVQQPLSGGMLDHLQEIEVVGSSLSKSGGIVEVTARGGGMSISPPLPINNNHSSLFSALQVPKSLGCILILSWLGTPRRWASCSRRPLRMLTNRYGGRKHCTLFSCPLQPSSPFQVQYEVKRKLVEGSMRDRRKQQLKERDQMNFDLEAFKEK
jgi:hypothetical protein